MITEEQARTLFAGEPGGSIDAYAVLRAGRRARVRRRALVASGGVAVAAGTAALAVASTGSERASVVSPATTSPTASPRPSPTTTPLRLEEDQIGDAVLIGSYVADGERRDVVAYFSQFTDPEGTTTVMVCDATVRPDGQTEPVPGAGCQGPAVPAPGSHLALGGNAPGASEDAKEPGPLGHGFTYSVVSTSVTRGGAYDETGAFHEGRVLGIGDPALPARILVVQTPGRWFRGYRLWDAAGTLLADEGPWPASELGGPRRSESPAPHGPE